MNWRRSILLAAILAGGGAAALAAAQDFDQARVMREMMAAQAPNTVPPSAAPPASAPGGPEGQPGNLRPAAPTGGSPAATAKTGTGSARDVRRDAHNARAKVETPR